MTRGTVLVTGASTGIGEALARQFADNDFDLIIVARRQSNLESIANDLEAKVRVEVISCDLSTDSGLDSLLQSITDSPIDVLVNNVGIALHGCLP